MPPPDFFILKGVPVMCGRYYIDDETAREIERLVRHLDQKLTGAGKRDVFPSGQAPVITGRQNEFAAELFTWGFPGFGKSNLIINARSETALDKKTFRDSIQSRRCAIPAAGFYEWNSEKEKYTFRKPDGRTCYLAGFYKEFDKGVRFVILTTDANDSMKNVHDRMPLVLNEEELDAWIFDDSQTELILHKVPGPLKKEAEYEQQTLPLL